MKNAEAVLAVKFKSTIAAGKLMETCHADLHLFRDVPGLKQKFYLSEEATGAISGIYLFEDQAARETFWSSELAGKIPVRYGVIPDSLRVERYEIAIVMNEPQFA